MNENLDLTKILKDCPIGMELYSSIYGTIVFEGINEGTSFPIITNKCVFTSDGRYWLDGELAVFPSKDQRDWSKWQRPFVDGDIVANNNQLFIFKKYKTTALAECYVFLDDNGKIDLEGGTYYVSKYATEEEKQRLLNTLKESGYEWDPDKKELKKIEPKFDISSLQPFDKVLVRCDDSCNWTADIYSSYDCGRKTFRCVGYYAFQCIPYNEETKHLLGTTQQAPKKYIVW